MIKRLIGLVMLVLVTGVVMADTPVTGRAGRAELRFLEGMADHHQMALDMAEHCLAKATNTEVKALCEAIITAQTAEITQMVGWIKTWYDVNYSPVAMIDSLMEMSKPNPHAGHGGAMPPQSDPAMMMGMFAGLTRLTGNEYDVAWLESMIDHHDDALHMSERVLEREGIHEETRLLAEAIISAQTEEMTLMETLLLALSN